MTTTAKNIHQTHIDFQTETIHAMLCSISAQRKLISDLQRRVHILERRLDAERELLAGSP